MQITIDTETDSKERLLLVSELLQKLAGSTSAVSPERKPVKRVDEFIAEVAEEPLEPEEEDERALPSLAPGVQYYS